MTISFENYMDYCKAYVEPLAQRFEKSGYSKEHVKEFAQAGLWNARISKDYGGHGIDLAVWGLICKALGATSMDTLNLFNVQNMVAEVLEQWASPELKAEYLPQLASGNQIAAFALTEPNVGSNASAIETTVEQREGVYILTGTKKWISFATFADVFLVAAKDGSRVSTFLVPKETPGLRVKPIVSALGFRGSMLGEIHFEDCEISNANLVGFPGMGMSTTVAYGLSYGRYNIAYGSLGLMRACLDASLAYSSRRKQFGKLIGQHQLIAQLLCEMSTHFEVAKLFCQHVTQLAMSNSPDFIMEVARAKYFCSRMAMQTAEQAVQIHGANGCSPDYPVERYFRDAKVLEIIEGSSQIQQIFLGQHVLTTYRRRGKASA